MNNSIEPGDSILGPLWKLPVQVIKVELHEQYGHVLVTLLLSEQQVVRTYAISADEWNQVQRLPEHNRDIRFDADPTRFALGIEAHRLRLIHSIDPYMALNASRIDPLPHQFEAVYEHLLARPIVRALLAHDAGAGKTIMAGMLIKELKRRQGIRRVLILTPAGLTIQWRRELLTKFGEDFKIVSRDHMEREHLDALEAWRQTDFVIASIDFVKQKAFRQALETVEWDLAIVDEAHKLAAYVTPSGSVRKTKAFELGETVARHSTHFLLMTATPHKGDPDNYRMLIDLIDMRRSRGRIIRLFRQSRSCGH